MKRFTELDEEFICLHCGKKVPQLHYSSRDHCPYCLYSLHVDINPGDRQNTCHGLLEPIGIEKYKDTYKIIYRCTSCGEIHKNIMAKDDDYDEVLRISARNFQPNNKRSF